MEKPQPATVTSPHASDDASAALARLRPLLEIAALVRGDSELGPLLAELGSAITTALGWRTVVFNVYRASWDDFGVMTVHGDDRLREALVGTTTDWAHWHTLLDEDNARRGAYIAADDSAQLGLGRISVPLAHSEGHLLGVLSVDELVTGAEPTDDDLDLLTTIAANGARAIEHVQRRAERERAKEALEHLHAVSARLASGFAAEEALSAVSDGIASALGFDKVAVLLKDGYSFAPVASTGFDEDDPALDFHITNRQISTLFEPRFEIEGCYLLTRQDALARCKTGSQYRSQRNGRGPWAWNGHWLLAPLFDDRGGLTGFVWADDPVDRLLPSRERLRVLRMFANHAATAVELARTFAAEQDANERLRASITASPLATFSLDHDAVITSWNPAAERLYGWTADELVGKPYPLASSERRLEFEHLLRSVLEGNSFNAVEIVREAADGRRVDVSSSAAPLRNADGEVTGAIVLHEDITARKVAQRELEGRHRELAALHRTTLDLIETLDEDGVIEAIVRRACQLLGTAHGYVFLLDEGETELVARHGIGLFKDLADVRVVRGEGVAGTVWAGGETLSVEDYDAWSGRSHQYRGSIHLRAVAGVPLRSRRGVIGVFGVGRDDDVAFTRSDLDLLEQFGRLASLALDNARSYTDLRKSEERYSRVVETSMDSIVLFELDGTIAFASRANEAILGYTTEELIGRSFPEFIHPDDLEPALEVIRRSLDTGESGSYAARIRHKDGHWVVLEGKPAPVRNESGRVELILAVARNVTDRERNEERRRELEEQLRQSQKLEAIGRLSGGIAHDFNNLLTAIVGYGDLALAAAGDAQPELHDDIQEMLGAAERARQLIRQLLAFSRKQMLQPSVLDLNEVVHGMDSILSRLLGEDVVLETQLEPALARTNADPGQIEQVVMNLALNARDAVAAGGRLLIQTRNDVLDEEFASLHPNAPVGPVVVLQVVDTGQGMTEDVRERVFEPFFTTKDEGQGTGLGLATVYGIVTQSGGVVTCDSVPGEGTTFTVYLPQFHTVTPSEDTRGHLLETPLGGTETVLLAEDEEVVRKLVAETLGRLGYTVVAAANGEEALSLLSDEIDLLLTDVVMPGMGGRELAAHVRDRRPDARVLFMTGYDSDSVRAEGAPALDAPLLEKPFTPGVLGEKVRAVLDG